MKTHTIAIVIFSGLLAMYSCKGNKTPTDSTTETGSAATADMKPDKNSGSAPKTYEVTATPDSAVLGKNQEVLVKIKNIKAIQLSSPDQDNTGIQLSYDLEVTNKSSIGGSSVYVNPSDFRLELDNGTKLSHDTYNAVSVDADATASSKENIFMLPAGTKPVSLNLFFSDTRATVKLELK